MTNLPYLPIHETSIPQSLPKVPTESGNAVEEAEFEKIADAEVGEGAGLLLMQHTGFGGHVGSDELVPEGGAEQRAQYLENSIHPSIRAS